MDAKLTKVASPMSGITNLSQRSVAARIRLVDTELAEQLRNESLSFPSLTLTWRQLCDLELLINGGFAPLEGFMARDAYDVVVDSCRLPDGRPWPIPIVLDIDEAFAEQLEPGARIALRDQEGFMLAVLTMSSVWQADKAREAEGVFGTASADHPGVRYLYERVKTHYLTGVLHGIQLPAHHDFESLWNSPEELRYLFGKMGWRNVIAFQTTDPIHKIQRRMIIDAAKAHQARVLIHPAVGETKPGDLQLFRACALLQGGAEALSP